MGNRKITVEPTFDSPAAMRSITCPPWYAQTLVILYLVAMMALGCRSLVLKDAQFGWGMFSRQINYTVRYRWVIDDGSPIKYWTGHELRRENRGVNDFERHQTRYGIGAVRRWIRRYLQFVYETHNFDGVVAIQAELRFQVNLDDDSSTQEIITYRPEAAIPDAN